MTSQTDNSKDDSLDECKKLLLSSATERDPARRLELSYELSLFLTRSDGLNSLLSSVIDFDTSSQKQTTHNQRFIAIANIITRLPRICVHYNDYCTNLMKQLKPILKNENPLYSSLACIIVKALLESPHATSDITVKIVLNPILDGLRHAGGGSYLPDDSIIVIHNLIVNRLSTDYFIEVFAELFYALVILFRTPSSLKTMIKTSLNSIINDMKHGPACCLLEKTLFHDLSVFSNLDQKLDDHGISIQVLKEPKSIGPDPKILTKLILEIIEGCNNDQLTLEFFFHFQECMWNKNRESDRHLSAKLLEPLLDDTVEEKSTKLDLSSIIATNQSQCLQLVHRTLLNYLSKLKHPDNKFDMNVGHELEAKSIKSCLNILQVLSYFIDDHDRYILLLKEMKHELEVNYPKSEITYDVVLALESSNLRNLTKEKVSGRSQLGTEDEYSKILKDMNDKLVPVRVHGLIRFKQLIISNDTRAISKIPSFFEVVMALLDDQEPYLFLASIGLLVEMALRRTDFILPKMIELYQSKDFEVQNRINIGEALTRLLRQLNEAAPIYARRVINSLINSSRDNEELIRMSSLTNLGQICNKLKHSLENYILDILSVVEFVLAEDTIQVRTAAIDLLRTTLMGLDKLTVIPIQKDLKKIYQLLKDTKRRTLDEHLCLQVDLTLDELDRIARELLVGTQDKRLVKNLRVLNLE